MRKRKAGRLEVRLSLLCHRPRQHYKTSSSRLERTSRTFRVGRETQKRITRRELLIKQVGRFNTVNLPSRRRKEGTSQS